VVHIRILLERVYPLDMILIFCYMHREGFFWFWTRALGAILYQSSTQTHMDLWNSAMGYSLYFRHQYLPVLSIQDCQIHSEHILVHKQPQDPWRSTNEHSSQWNRRVEYLILKKVRKPH
jgi:hypothetical protein